MKLTDGQIDLVHEFPPDSGRYFVALDDVDKFQALAAPKPSGFCSAHQEPKLGCVVCYPEIGRALGLAPKPSESGEWRMEPNYLGQCVVADAVSNKILMGTGNTTDFVVAAVERLVDLHNQSVRAPKPERESVKLREALEGVNKYIPELWGDHCQDGMVDLSIPAEVIEDLQAALASTPANEGEKR